MILSDYNIDSIYFNISLLIYKSNKVINGIFKRNLMLENIFIISSKIIGIDVDYILLRDNTEMIYNQSQTFHHFHIRIILLKKSCIF